MGKPEIKISVRNLIEFILRSGDIGTGFISNSRALEGSKIHRKLQKSAGDEYTSEVYLKWIGEFESFSVIIDGRADGIIKDGTHVTIDEIKTVTTSLELIDENYNSLHWAQAKCYAFIYAEQNCVEDMEVQLTYYNMDTEEIKLLQKSFTIRELKQFFYELLDQYVVWAQFACDWRSIRNGSIKDMKFPFDEYRKGQRELAVAAYRTLAAGKKLFVQAPTGIGKTISTLFPALKAMGEGVGEKIFYLTAKTITRQVAEDAFEKMRSKGLRCKTITLTAKEKICLRSDCECDPEKCQYAQGHFDRVNDALMDIVTHQDTMTRDVVTEYAVKHQVCPFEFSLDLAIWMDCVILDYNYVFDPRVYLKRFFLDNNKDYTFLIDEAHNLVDRARDMFSAELSKRNFMDVRKTIKSAAPDVFATLGKINRFFIDMRKACNEKGVYRTSKEPKELYPLLKEFIKGSEAIITKNKGAETLEGLLELYFECIAFVKIAEFFDERYVTYVSSANKEVKLKLFCLDPSFLLKEVLKRGKSAVFFSATLTPLNYFREILGGDGEDYVMRLESPFDRNKLCLLVAGNVSTRYKDRENSYQQIVEYIQAAVNPKAGNFLVFFPSFEYLREVLKLYTEMYPEEDLIVQENGMKEEDREAFLAKFASDGRKPVIGFAVMGGVFSEGVDLTGERLVGAIIVGVGLPQLNPERDIMMEYFKNKNGLGYEYAYMYPGMNKVLQAAGRVIRTEQDRGTVLLIDERFLHRRYRELFPREWSSFIKINKDTEVEKELKGFWGR